MMELKLRTKSSCRGASAGARTQAPFLGIFLNNNFLENDDGAWVPVQLDASC